MLGTHDTSTSRHFWIDDYGVDPDGLIVHTSWGDVTLEPKIMKILTTLATYPDEVVTRQTLLDSVREESHVSDESLTRAISILRKTFRDTRGRRTVIETVPRRGYKLVGKLTHSRPEVRDLSQPKSATLQSVPNVTHAKNFSEYRKPTYRNAVLATLILVAIVVGAMFVRSLKIPSNTAPGRSIAVLPFNSLSVDPGDELFAEGLAEELLYTLSGLSDLKVAARTSSFVYKNKSADVREIGESLNVSYVLEGSIRRTDGRMRITAQLISTKDGYNLWSRSYDRQIEDVFSVQNDIARHVAAAFDLELPTNENTLFDAGTTNVDAFKYYLEGRDYLHKRGLGLSQAISKFEKAIELDPNYAKAYAGLATSHVVSHIYLDVPKVISQQRAVAFAQKSISLDPSLSEPFAVLGVTEADNNNWKAAIDFYKQGEILDPDNVVVLQWYAEALTYLGYLDQAEAKMSRALEIEPNSAILFLVAGLVAQNKDDMVETERLYRRSKDLGLSDGVNGNSFVEFRKGNLERAANMMALASFNDRYIGENQVEELTQFILSIMKRELKVDDGIAAFPALAADDDFLVPAYLMSGESKKALLLLENDPDGDHDSFYLLWTNTDPDLRKNPYFKTFAKNTGLFDYWQVNGWPDKCQPLNKSEYQCN